MRRADPIPELKRQLAAELLRALKGWPAGEIRFYIKLDQPRLSDLRRGKLDRFSAERLVRLLSELDYAVELCVTKRSRERERT